MMPTASAYVLTEKPGIQAPPYRRGKVDESYFFRSASGRGGFLVVSGWFTPVGAENHQPIAATLRLGDEQWSFRWGLPRPDVAGADAQFSPHSGFAATLPVTRTPGPGSRFSIDFLAKDGHSGTLHCPVEFPEYEVEARASDLAPLRLKKLRNLILNERERLSQVERVRSMPVTGQIDPAFACNLECPLCLSQMIREDRYTLPNMRLGQLDHILGQYGDYLVRIWLSLWGEPLLNKNLPEMIRRCKQHDIWVLISSNMSVPLDDAAIEALVASGLDTISLSIDGATQATYEQYRKRGNLGLALDNARRLVAAKRRQRSATPHLYWRYLRFPWNGHEIEMARQLAVEIGVDEFGIEPGIMTQRTKHSKSSRPVDEKPLPAPANLIARRQQQADRRRTEYRYFGCDYLYQSISVNSNGLVHPCCYVVSPEHATGRAEDPVEAIRNGKVLRSSRRHYQQLARGKEAGAAYEPCLSCGVVATEDGHVRTQTNFVQLYEYLLSGIPMRW